MLLVVVLEEHEVQNLGQNGSGRSDFLISDQARRDAFALSTHYLAILSPTVDRIAQRNGVLLRGIQ